MSTPFVAQTIDLVDHQRLIPADYNPREMDPRTLKVLVRSLVNFGWVLPAIVNRRTGNIVGGHQRLRANARALKLLPATRAKHYRRVPVIYVDLPLEREKALNIALNQISGDWDFFKRAAADELRQNATHAQMTRRHHELSRGYRAPLGLMRFDFRDRTHLQRFTGVFGTKILDFGCGKGQEVGWLGKLGIRAVGFEPFRRATGSGRLDIRISRSQADGFLRELSGNFTPDTVFCNYVISSIASAAERRLVLTILQALSQRAARVVVAVRSTDDVCYQQVLGRVQAKSGYLGIPDKTEPGLVVTGAGTSKQKFQKFYDAGEFTRLLRKHFGQVELHQLERGDPALVAVCTCPRPVVQADLERALRFEFDLKINGEPLGFADRAILVFSRWLARGQKRRAG